jgi:hypothetical protein
MGPFSFASQTFLAGEKKEKKKLRAWASRFVALGIDAVATSP